MRAIVVVAAALLAAVGFAATAAAGEPPFQLPWPTGQSHAIAFDSNTYGCDTHTGSDGYALDFPMTPQNSIASTAAGTVTTVGDQGGLGYGKYVIVTHQGGFTSIYAHLNGFSVSPGQSVKQGQVVGLSGNTGYSTGPHLHWAVRLNGGAYKPEPASWYSGFGSWGACGNGQASPTYISKAPANNDYNGNSCPDIMARSSSTGQLWMYPGPCSTGYPGSPVQYSSNWSSLNAGMGAGGYSADGCVDVVGRRASDSALLLYAGRTSPACSTAGYGSPVTIGTGWGSLQQIFSPRDFTGDGCSDIIARDSSGNLLLYNGPAPSGNCSGGELAYFGQIGNGWNTYNNLLGPGDYSGDGCFDVAARRVSDGALFLWEGNCNGAFKTGNAIQIGSGWANYTTIIGPGDYDNDGCADIIGLRNDGLLYLFRGNCTPGWLGGGIQIGNGWTGFNLLF